MKSFNYSNKVEDILADQLVSLLACFGGCKIHIQCVAHATVTSGKLSIYC